MQVTIYHNPRCSKSRETLSLLKEKGIDPTVILYLNTPPDVATLQALLKKLGFTTVRQLMRRKEERYLALGLDDKNLSEMQLLQAMAENPALIERPIVVCGDRAQIGRPPIQALTIL